MFRLRPSSTAILTFAFLSVWTIGTGTAAQQAPSVKNHAPQEENFSDLRANSKVFAEIDPVVIDSDETPDYKLEFLDVQWRSGDPIHLSIIKPAGVKNPPVVLYLYSYPSETSTFLNPNFCKFATKNGFAAVGFVSAFTGHRYHDIPMREWFVSNLDEALGLSVHDVQMVLNYLSTRGDLDMKRVGMFGDGSGASIAIMTAAVDPRIRVLDLLNPWGDWPTWMAKSTLVPEEERPDYMKPDFLKKVAPFDPVKWLPQLEGKSVRLQEVMDVTVTPGEAAKRIEAWAPATVEVVHYKNRETFLNDVAQKGTALDWIKERLRGEKLTASDGARTDKASKRNQ
jgi:hypothetical protein